MSPERPTDPTSATDLSPVELTDLLLLAVVRRRLHALALVPEDGCYQVAIDGNIEGENIQVISPVHQMPAGTVVQQNADIDLEFARMFVCQTASDRVLEHLVAQAAEARVMHGLV